MIRHLGRVADIIFALAMAQCILGFQVPETAKSFTEKEVFDFLLAQLEPLTAYAVAFIVVGFYWIDHVKRFRYYKQTNEIHLWICLLYLMGLFLIPYSNALVIFFAENLVAKVWFSTNTAFIGFLSFLNWVYATHQHRLIETELDDKTITTTRWNALVEPVFSLLTIGVALIDQAWWDYVWFLLPIPYFLIEKLLKQSFLSSSVNSVSYKSSEAVD